MGVPPMENPTCAAFEKNGDVPETMPLELSDDDVIWVAYNLSGATGALGAEGIGLRNWLFHFRYASEEFRFIVANLDDWMSNSPPLLGILTML